MLFSPQDDRPIYIIFISKLK